MKTLRRIITSAGLFAPGIVLAQGGNGFGGDIGFQGTKQGSNLVGSITDIVNAFLVLAALAAAIFLIIGGVRYIASQGDESRAEAAKNTILYAVIGLIVIGLAAVVVNFTVDAIGN